MKEKNKQKLATLFLMTAMFLNPMGFDVVQLTLIELTGSLLRANLVMYCLAVFFFGLYFYFSGNNPIKTIKDIILTVYFDRIHHFFLKKKKDDYILEEIDETDKPV
jgi:hypothetical protein